MILSYELFLHLYQHYMTVFKQVSEHLQCCVPFPNTIPVGDSEKHLREMKIDMDYVQLRRLF